MNRIKEVLHKGKELLLVSLAVMTVGFLAALLLPNNTAKAQPVAGGVGYYTPTPVVVSTATAPTNSHFGLTTNGIWPNGVIGGDIVTNLTKVDVSSYKEVTIETGCSLSAAAGAVAGQQVVWTIYKNVRGGNPTNAIGTGLWLEPAGKITNAFATSAPIGSNSVSHLTLAGGFSGTVPAGYSGDLGGMTTLYIGVLDASAVTNGGAYVTNYAAYVSGK